MKKTGPKKYKEFDTAKLGNLRDITEEKFRLKLIDHYHRMLQNRQKLPNDYIFALSKLLRFKDKNYQNNRKLLKDIFIDLRFDILDELIQKVSKNNDDVKKKNDEEYNKNENNKEINSRNKKNINFPNDEKKEKNPPCCEKSKIKTYPFANLKPIRNPPTSAEFLPNSSANFFKEKTSIFNILGFMVNLDLENNNKDMNSVYPNSNSNMNNEYINEGNENFDLDESEIKFVKSERNEIKENEKTKSNYNKLPNDNRSNFDDNKSNNNFKINKSMISKSNNGNNIVNHENGSINKTMVLEKNVNETIRNNEKVINNELKNGLKSFSKGNFIDYKLKVEDFYNLNHNRRKVKNINRQRDENGEFIDYYVISDSFESIDSFKLKKFKKKLEKNNVYFGYKSELKNKKNLSKSVGLSQNLGGSVVFSGSHFNNNINNYNSNSNTLLGGEMRKNNLNNYNDVLPSIGFASRERNKQKSATANRNFLSYILKVSNKLGAKMSSENVVAEEKDFIQNQSNDINNNEYYLDNYNSNKNTDNNSNYVRANEYSPVRPSNEFSPTTQKTLTKKISRNLINLYNEYRSHKNQDSISLKNLQSWENEESISNRDVHNDPKNFKIQSNLEAEDFNPNCYKENDYNYNMNYNKNPNYICSNYIENNEFNKNSGAEYPCEIKDKRKLNISNFQKMQYDNDFEGNMQQLPFDNYNFHSNLNNNKSNEVFHHPENDNNNNFTNKTENSNNLLRRQSKQKSKNMSLNSDLKLITSSKLKVTSELLIKEPRITLRDKAAEGNTNGNWHLNEENLIRNEFRRSKIKLADVNRLQEKVQFLKETNQPKFNAVNKYSGSLIKSLKKIDKETNQKIDFMDKNKFRSQSKINDLKIFQAPKKFNQSNTKFK